MSIKEYKVDIKSNKRTTALARLHQKKTLKFDLTNSMIIYTLEINFSSIIRE